MSSIDSISILDLPPRVGGRRGTGELEPIVAAVLGLPRDQALEIEARSRSEAMKLARRVCVILRDRRVRVRSRTALVAGEWSAFLWRDGGTVFVPPSRQRKTG